MAKLNANDRKELPKSDFGLPGDRKYPMPDAAHAANAKARAEQQFEKGNLSAAQKAEIDRKADTVLHHAHRRVEDTRTGKRHQ